MDGCPSPTAPLIFSLMPGQAELYCNGTNVTGRSCRSRRLTPERHRGHRAGVPGQGLSDAFAGRRIPHPYRRIEGLSLGEPFPAWQTRLVTTAEGEWLALCSLSVLVDDNVRLDLEQLIPAEAIRPVD